MCTHVSRNSCSPHHYTVSELFLSDKRLHKLQSEESINHILSGSHRPNTLLYINKPTAPAGKMFQTSFSRPETLCKERMTLTMGLMHQTPAKQISGNIPKTILPNSCKNGFLQMIYTEMCVASYVELRQEAKINILPALKAN